jgi:hypothetical protein
MRILLIIALVAAIGYHRAAENTLVTGGVHPTDAGLRAWLFSATDTLTAAVDNGRFQISNVKPGSYRLMIEGRPPYRNGVKDGIRVFDGAPTDVGLVEMEQ